MKQMRIPFLKTFRESFGVRVFVAFAFLIAVISFSFTAFLIHSERKSLTDSLNNKGELLSKILAYSSRIGVFSENEALLEDPIKGVFLQEGVLEVSVFNLKGELLKRQEDPGIKEREKPVWEGEQSTDRIFNALGESVSPLYIEYEDVFQFWAPVVSGTGYLEEEALFLGEDPLQGADNVIGFVRITIDKHILQARLAGLLIRSILIGFAFLLLGFGLTYAIAKGVTRPLKKLTNGVTALGMGGEVERITVETEDEIGNLAEAFNTMSESLKKREEALLESEKRLRSLSSELLKAQEKERRRLSKELHDELGQALALLKHRVRSIQRRLDEHQSSLWKECEETSWYVDETIENVRRLSRELSPAILEDLGLSAALQWLADNYAERHSIQMSVDIDNIDHLLSQEAQTNLYRISQEALTNIARHAEASQVLFTVQRNGKNLLFVVDDDGKGFDVNQVKATVSSKKGIGLAAMEERAHMLGAVINVKSETGKGTRISLKIPLEREE